MWVVFCDTLDVIIVRVILIKNSNEELRACRPISTLTVVLLPKLVLRFSLSSILLFLLASGARVVAGVCCLLITEG